ncbi:6160_t:CDS:2, partial [Dentiscutata erythropus]
KKKKKLETIAGISNLQEWTWPTNGEKIGFIAARALPELEDWKEWSLANLNNITKSQKTENPNPTSTNYTQPINLEQYQLFKIKALDKTENSEP